MRSNCDLVWGVGPTFQLPTATNDLLGTGKWSAGPGFVAFFSVKPLHITTGFLINNIWSFAGDDDRTDVNAMTLQPFLNYNLPKGWYLTTAPLITGDWESDAENRWTVPIGGGIGRIFKIGHQPTTMPSGRMILARIGSCAPSGRSSFQNIRGRPKWPGAMPWLGSFARCDHLGVIPKFRR